jgi:hypothetical protein
MIYTHVLKLDGGVVEPFGFLLRTAPLQSSHC